MILNGFISTEIVTFIYIYCQLEILHLAIFLLLLPYCKSQYVNFK